VLALSKNSVRLFKGHRHGMSGVELSDVPRSLAEALRTDDPEKQLQWHTGTPPAPGERAAMFHGHGASVDAEKKNLLRFVQLLDRGLRPFLGGDRVPLVLAGVDHVTAVFRERTKYPAVMEERIAGNPDDLSSEELHKRAWAIMEPRFATAREDAVEQYRRLARTDKTAGDIKNVVRAAVEGRVRTLLVAVDAQKWGIVTPASGEVALSEQGAGGSVDLLDYATVQTLEHGGTAFPFRSEAMPGASPVAALLRY
jgi:hypothetical protein